MSPPSQASPFLPTIPRGQINLKAARPQLKDHTEQRHVEIAAKKAGAELGHVLRQQVPNTFVGCCSQFSPRCPEVHVCIGDLDLIEVLGVSPINPATAGSAIPPFYRGYHDLAHRALVLTLFTLIFLRHSFSMNILRQALVGPD